MTLEMEALLHLSLINGIGSGAIFAIYKKILNGNEWQNLYSLTILDFKAGGFSAERSERIYTGLKDFSRLEREKQLLDKHNITLLSFWDDQYPRSLKEIYAAPALLYVKGSLPEKRCIAFVGSREANHYARKAIEKLVPGLVEHDIAIVSGGAIGADSMAHRKALDAGGYTIVVLGSGLARPYPFRNHLLFDEIINNEGALISSFAMTTDPLPGNFVARNRIIAGLSDGIVVVQARSKSGTRITAQYALDQGKDVFAVPGLFDESLSEGCHQLIQEGAKLVQKVDDILEEYDIVKLSKINGRLLSVGSPDISSENSFEQHIITQCQEPVSVDELAANMNINIETLQHLLFEMQVAGKIEQNFAGLWRAM